MRGHWVIDGRMGKDKVEVRRQVVVKVRVLIRVGGSDGGVRLGCNVFQNKVLFLGKSES